ncbi:heme exporter protein CcmD [Bordetella petrii]|uniref:heme exporter protein CcmD n=1 Tax=Bordetella petrii TaxID=94624 RepID=UPI001E3D8679|nr:heme exporter protein CcmD [Bordetella petrii]MCD0501406.1 heme exporter protein CcmD [Bordetella petrii]
MNRFSSFAEFLAMGSHGVYVWTAYAFSLALLCWMALAPLLARRLCLKAMARRTGRQVRP